MSYFLKNKGKKCRKGSKTVKKTNKQANNGNIKFNTMRHPKTVLNLLKLIAQP